jgi:hypothetical protein
MMRTFVCALAVLALVVVTGTADDKKQTKQNQMVRGTVKVVNVKDGVLVVSQKVKNENVDRQLDIKDATLFVITIGGEKKEVNGKDGLALLEGKEGSPVQVKCDKDVNVLQVTVTIKK